MAEQVSHKPALLQRISYVAVLIAIAFVFAVSGMMKLIEAEEIVNNFTKWDLIRWMKIIGGIELLAVLLYLFPRTNLIGALLFTITMAGAIYIHARHDEPHFFNVAVVAVTWINYFFIKPKK